ncbi:unnamed protein product [Trichogramma brassicae]|uniref:carnitine O-palmitoyltransferase n=1 Tax=Trichogramma brassicae TaxID=86971 RepID=A0A6H5HYV7_9HYME|nr:unnamed protein product [Trichogramma brassicae]
MAEAHAAVAFQFSITHEGWDVNFDREVLNLVWQSGIRSWKKRYFRFINNIKTGVYPASLNSLWLTVIMVMAIHFAGYKVPYVGSVAPYLFASYVLAHMAGCFLVGLLLWLVTIHAIRYILKLLLMYKGWMYESRGPGSRVSLTTKLWAVAVKIFSGWHKPMLYSFQGSLPRLPLPSVEDTAQRYLRSVRPLLDDDGYRRMEQLAREFQRGIGVKLQRYLILKSWWSSNYVSDWWEEYVYLRGRSPIMVNSNFYGIDAILMHPTRVQSARAASVIHSCLQYRRLIERQDLEPILVQGIVPLCSWQYERVFNTTRIPGIETDKIVHFNDSKHVVVYHKGKYFRLPIYHKNRLLQPCEIELQIQSILDDTSSPYEGEERLASLTAGERVHWAKSREEHFARGINKISLDLIEKSAFVVALDDVPYEFDKSHPEKLDNYGRILLHGKGHDRWFDKSFTLCIGSNGRVSEELVNGLDLRIYVHDLYGKGFMKKSKVSPDAYIQMALQLAYYRDAGKFSLTYEASMTRLYREGRTETVRPCTIESVAWVKAMENKNATVQDRHKCFMAAVAQHQRGYQDAMCGKGIDRHLFCLYVVSKYLEVDSPFLKEVLSEPWRLSTSQTPHGQTSKLDLKKYPDCISAGGGFGPVADDGYGVSYIIAGEDMIFFHISSKFACPKTSSRKFADEIKKALMDMKELFTEREKIQNQVNGFT